MGSGNFYAVLLGELGITGAVLLGGEVFRRFRHPGGARKETDRPAAVAPLRARLFLRTLLGALWVLDGLLQAQPSMPTGFSRGVLVPAAAGQPAWLAALVHGEIGIWQAHPVHLAVATILIQVGLGVAILAGGDSRWGRAALWSSIGWGGLVWLLGEGAGGLFAPGASLLSGAPGSVLAYMAAAGLLLAPHEFWRSGRARRSIEIGVGATFLLGVMLQTTPEEGFWTAAGIGGPFQSMARVPQPLFLSDPIRTFGNLAASNPLLWNTVMIFVLAGLGVGLCLGCRSTLLLVAALAWLAFAWWFGQDFGTFGTGVATDPNLAPLLAALLLTARLSPGRSLPGEQALWWLGRQTWVGELAVAGILAVAVGALGGLPYVSQAVWGGGVATATAAAPPGPGVHEP